MSELIQVIPIKGASAKRLSLALISALFAALLLVMFSVTTSADGGEDHDGHRGIGRGFIAKVTSIDLENRSLTVESRDTVFQVSIGDSTIINHPPDRDVGLEGLPTDLGFRIAGLVDLPITDADGNLSSEELTAQKLTVIPAKATRRHRRSIAVDKQGDRLTTLDEDGETTDLPGHGAGFEKGDKIIMLIQSARRRGIGEKVLGIFKAGIVDDRLARLAKDEADDPDMAAGLAKLRNERADAQEKRLQRTAEHAGSRFRDFVLDTVQNFRITRVLQDGEGATDRSSKPGPIIANCARTKRQRGTADCLNTDESPDASLDVDLDAFTVADGDCNDVDASVYPGATDVPDDGIDQDCDGSDSSADADADGFTVADGDCNDVDASVYPGAADVPDDGIDQDCDGSDATTG